MFKFGAPMNQSFLNLLEKMKITHQKKNDDYAGNNNVHENFERMALVSEWFHDPLDKVYTSMITVKLARLATLLNKEAKGESPNNESVEDSFLDLTNYCALWYSNYVDRTFDKESQTVEKVVEGDLKLKLDDTQIVNVGAAKATLQCKKCGVQFSYTPFVFMSAARGLKEFFCSSSCKGAAIDAQYKKSL